MVSALGKKRPIARPVHAAKGAQDVNGTDVVLRDAVDREPHAVSGGGTEGDDDVVLPERDVPPPQVPDLGVSGACAVNDEQTGDVA
jgi:hypothetical protein